MKQPLEEERIIFDYVMACTAAQLKAYWLEEYGNDDCYSALYFVHILHNALPEFAEWEKRQLQIKTNEEYWSQDTWPPIFHRDFIEHFDRVRQEKKNSIFQCLKWFNQSLKKKRNREILRFAAMLEKSIATCKDDGERRNGAK